MIVCGKYLNPDSSVLLILPVSPNNRMQRSGYDKVHAPDSRQMLEASRCALQAQSAVADAGR
jgi:hypothetical protein